MNLDESTRLRFRTITFDDVKDDNVLWRRTFGHLNLGLFHGSLTPRIVEWG
ncbi:Hypothetical protein Cp3995_0615 [Corynebacterium pseudotuberculosis 3/99-5]|nr:Hypothetical protein Cp3995_0615 [Corynebacterium pseudotuberculosis 3/99-5]